MLMVSDRGQVINVNATLLQMLAMEREVVAEGVETAEQLHFLESQSCDYVQGYFFSRPVSLDNFKKLLAPNIAMLRNGEQRLNG